tara:strand:+ start:1874 stop:3106 length:1233 start_codon:yes stop_codon:yes gene_type:complete
MNHGYLSQYFSGVVVKHLSSVEADPSKSNQHEFNGSLDLRNLLGEADRKDIPTRFLWLDEEQSGTESEDGLLTWYDARRAHPSRTEYRLYYKSNGVTEMMRGGDAFFLALRSDGTGLIVVTPSNSTIYNQLLWLFGIEKDPEFAFQFAPVDGNRDAQLDFASRMILDALGVDTDEPDLDEIDTLIEAFGLEMPRPRDLSALARNSIGVEVARDDPDQALLLWMERELQLFRRIERKLVAKRIAQGFGERGAEDVDDFISFSLSVQNRRKARAGLALESHIEALLLANRIRYVRGAVTENGNRPDFLFPGINEYRDKFYPHDALFMLGAKSTLKERWRQVLSEAVRIEKKHLLTLEPGISEAQTDEMRVKNLQLVLPREIHRTYKPLQQSWLMTLSDFLGLMREAGYSTDT